MGQLQQRHLGAAQRQAVAVVVAVFRQLDAESAQLAVKGARRDHDDGAHRRHVERGGQRGARRHPALELAVVVLRDVQAAGGLQLGGRVVQQRGGGEAPLGDGLGVQKGLERAAGLARRADGIDLARAAELARGANPGQHLAAGVVQHQGGAIFNVTPAQLLDVLLQQLQCLALQPGVDGGSQRRRRVGPRGGQQAACVVRGDAFAGGPGAARQGRFGLHVERHAVGGHPGPAHGFQHAASALRHARGAGVGRAHQGGGQRRFAVVQAVGGLGKQGARQCVHAHQFAAQRHQVEVGLQDLVLAPAGFEPRGHHGLAELLAQAAPAGAQAQILIQQAGQLHGERAGATRLGVPQVGPGGA